MGSKQPWSPTGSPGESSRPTRLIEDRDQKPDQLVRQYTLPRPLGSPEPSNMFVKTDSEDSETHSQRWTRCREEKRKKRRRDEQDAATQGKVSVRDMVAAYQLARESELMAGGPANTTGSPSDVGKDMADGPATTTGSPSDVGKGMADGPSTPTGSSEVKEVSDDEYDKRRRDMYADRIAMEQRQVQNLTNVRIVDSYHKSAHENH